MLDPRRVLSEKASARLFGCLLLLLLLAGCSRGREEVVQEMGPPPVQVIVEHARTEDVIAKLSLVATLTANETVEIRAEIDGVLKEILFEEGQAIEKGDTIARLESDKLTAELAEAQANLVEAETTYKRNSKLLEDQLIPTADYDLAAARYESAKAIATRRQQQLGDTSITAPFSGILGARNISPGQVITRHSMVTRLIDLDSMKVELDIPERFLNQLKLGQTIELQVAAFDQQTFDGTVFFIAPAIDPNTRTALVKASLPNPNRKLKPGMFANLELTLRTRENALVIPETAVLQVTPNNRAKVYLATGDNTAELRVVQLGVRMAGRIEVTDGLEKGDRIIVEGTQKIGPGSPIVPKPRAASPQALSHE